MTITGIDHIQLAMPAGGEQEARQFYADLLGLSEVEKPVALAARGGCWFQNSHIKIHLGVEDSFSPAKRRTRRC